jgi:undecaprenyl-diphosphatase
MSIIQAIVLGIIQGLTEFLPISSSAHLALTPWIFGWKDPGLAFDVALHLGTLLAVLIFFRNEWIALTRAAFNILQKRRIETPEERRVIYLILATIPGGIAGKLLEERAETTFRSPALMATALMIMGVVLWAVDRWSQRDRTLLDMKWSGALSIGLAQVFALIPGVSRSGSTMTAARALRFDRPSAATFSFLMSMPITLAAVVFKMPDAVRQGGGVTPELVLGVLSAGISGWLAISVLLKYVAKHSYGVFAVYRVALGLVIFWLISARG